MLYTLSDARTAVKRQVNNGSCTNSVIDQKINDALERLIDAEDWECLRKFMRVTVCNRCFALPYNVEKIIFADVCGTPAKVFGTAYQFLSSGPGDLDYRTTSGCYNDLVDKGDDWPVMFDIPKSYDVPDALETVPTSDWTYPEGMKIVAFCEAAGDANKTMRVKGFTHEGVEVAVNGGSDTGEDLTIQRWSDGAEGTLTINNTTISDGLNLSTNKFQDISRIILPSDLEGYVTLYAVDTTYNMFFFLGKYHPAQKIPQFRRYSITNKAVRTLESTGSKANMLLLVKLRHIPLVHEDDIVPLDSLQALKLMIMALREEDAGNLQGSLMLEEKAKAVMGKREESRTMTSGTPVILNVDYRTSLGRALRRRVSI